MGGLENAEDALNLRPEIELFQARTVLFNTQIWIDPTRFYKVIELKRVFFTNWPLNQHACAFIPILHPSTTSENVKWE